MNKVYTARAISRTHLSVYVIRFFVGLMAAFFMSQMIRADQTPLFMQVTGSGAPTVVFISGNGNDSSVWTGIEAQVRAMGVRTVVYDRAGLGRSALFDMPYSVQAEANALKATLAHNDVQGPLVLVAHSYGGLIAALVAENNQVVKGIVFVDALLPSDMNKIVVQGVLDEYTPQFDAVRAAAPELAKAVIPVVQAYPETAERVQMLKLRRDMPIIDLVAENTWTKEPDQLAHVQQSHIEFAAQSSARTRVVLEGSSHNVMRDKPDAVVHAVGQIVALIK